MLLAPDRWQKVKQLFEQASDMPRTDWVEFLDEHCPNDEDIRSAVEQMLHAHSSAGRFLEDPALGEDFHLEQSSRSVGHQVLDASQQIGRYTIVRRISGGGMGDVYEATQSNPTRKVALKVMKSSLRSRRVQRRFEYESEMLAKLKHPAIAQVYESGKHAMSGDTVPWFALEFIEHGRSITQYADEVGLTIPQKMTLFAKVCDAVHHAHQNGIIHRDIKPANILVDQQGHPKLIDFGVARTDDITIDITTDHLVGTLQYMSPEQCSTSNDEVDLRTDIYSLGIVLYELLTGALPYRVDGGSLVKSARIVEQQKPVRPSSINSAINADTESVILNALRKNPSDRYLSVAGLARDVRAVLSNHPISARKPTITYHLRTWARRHRGIAVMCGLLVLLIVGAAGALTSQSIHIARERDRANRVSSYLESILIHGNPKSAGYDITMREVIDKAAATIHDDLVDDPQVEARVRWLLGMNVYWPMMRLDQAEQHMQASIRINEEMLGFDHPDVVCAKACLAELLLLKQDIPAAVTLLAAIENAVSPDHEYMVSVYDGLGTAARIQRDFKSARRHLEQSVAARERFYGRWSVRYAEGVERLADVLSEGGDIDESIKLQREGVRTRIAVVGKHDSGTAQQMGYLSSLLVMRNEGGDLEEAEALCRECQTIFESLAGKKDLDYAWITSYLAGTLAKQGRLEDANEVYQTALQLKRDIVGNDHIEVSNTLNALAHLKEMMGDYENAISFHKQALHIRKTTYGPNHYDVRCSLGHLENALRQAGRIDEADEVAAKLKTASASGFEKTNP